MFHSSMKGVEAFHENSEPFFRFLQSQGLDDLLGKTRLRLRKKHAIVPHVRGFIAFVCLHIVMWTSKQRTAHPGTPGRITKCIA